MPPLKGSIEATRILGKLVFCGYSHKRPDGDWDGVNDGEQYGEAREAADKVAIPGHFGPLPWFSPQAAHKDYQEMCDEVGQAYEDCYDGCLDAVVHAVDNCWRTQAKLKDLKVMACCAIGTPGCLDGPELESDIKNAPNVASWADNAKKFVEATAAGVSKCFKDYQGKVMVPGLPYYPAFAAYPGPTAAPVPNVPMPLIAAVSAMMTQITVGKMITDECISNLDQGIKDNDKDEVYKSLFDAIGTALSLAFLMWLPQQQIMTCQGKGPVPGYCPPYTPVCCVVMGDNIGVPGHNSV